MKQLTVGSTLTRLIQKAKNAFIAPRSLTVISKPNYGTFMLGDLGFVAATTEGYKNLVWVYRCVSAYSTAVASVPWKVYDKSGKIEKHLPGHPLETLLNQPNKFFGRREFMETTVAHLLLGGRSYWEKVMVRGKTVELWNIRPDWMTPNPDGLRFISGYTLKRPNTVNDKPIEFDPEDIVSMKFIDPLDPMGSMSPISAASRTIDTENSAIRWNKSMLDNAAVPGGIFTIPAVNTTKDQRDDLREVIQSEYAGDDRFQTMILWGGMEWKAMALSPTDMQFLEQRRLNKYEICSVYGVPPQMVGAQEDPTYSNYAVARLSFWEDQVIPLLDWIGAKVNTEIAAPGWGEDIIVRYDISAVPAMREAFSQRVSVGIKLWQMKYPINVINERLGLGMPRVEWGDMAYEQLNQVPMTMLGTSTLLDSTPNSGDPNNPNDPNAPNPDDPAASASDPKKPKTPDPAKPTKPTTPKKELDPPPSPIPVKRPWEV